MARDRPLVSVGLPVFNGARYLRACLDSVLGQTLGDLELVVSDNASTDESAAICREYAARDPRLRYSRNERNIGGFRNQNRVFGLSRGRYFHWIGHDDRRAPEFLDRAVARLEADPRLVACYGRTRYIGADDEPLPVVERDLDTGAASASRRFRELTRLDHKCEPVYGVIRADVLARTGLQGQYADSDRVLAAELGLHGPMARIDEPLVFRRIHPGTSIEMYPSRQDRAAWYEPDRPAMLVFPYWRELAEFRAAVGRVPLPLGERLACHAHLLRWLVASRRALASDLEVAAYRLARRARDRWRASPAPGASP